MLCSIRTRTTGAKDRNRPAIFHRVNVQRSIPFLQQPSLAAFGFPHVQPSQDAFDRFGQPIDASGQRSVKPQNMGALFFQVCKPPARFAAVKLQLVEFASNGAQMFQRQIVV